MKLYKAILAALAITAVGAGFTSCDNDFDTPPVISPDLGGSGRWNAPLTVWGAKAYYTAYYSDAPDTGRNYWVTGYIVGCVSTTETVFTATDQTSEFNAPFGTDNNLLLAASPDETNYENCIALQLPSGNVRNGLGLLTNPTNKGRLVTVYGYIDKYLGLPGMRSLTNFNWGAEGIDTGEVETKNSEFTLATEIKSGRSYAIVGNGLAAQPLATDNGFLQTASVTVNDNKFKANESYGFLLTETAAGSGKYYINDYKGRFLYVGVYGSGYSNRPSASALFNESDLTYVWQIVKQPDGSWLIANAGAASYMLLDTSYNSYGLYKTTDGYVTPMLYEMANDPVTQPDFSGAGTPDIGNGSGEGTLDKPYDVAAVLSLFATGTVPAGEVHVEGEITNVQEVSTQYGNATYTIKSGDSEILVYRGKYLDNASFSAADQIKVGDKVVIKGLIASYNGNPQITNSSIVKLNGQGGGSSVDPGTNPGTPAGSAIYSGLLADSADCDWTFDNVQIDAALSYVWSWKEYNGSHYLNASAYLNSTAYPAEAYAYTSIDLSGYKTASVTFENAARFQTTLKDLCRVAIREQGASKWTLIDIPEWPAAGSWTFASSGTVDLSAFAGKKVDLGLKYGSSSAGADTWEIKNFIVNAAK